MIVQRDIRHLMGNTLLIWPCRRKCKLKINLRAKVFIEYTVLNFCNVYFFVILILFFCTRNMHSHILFPNFFLKISIISKLLFALFAPKWLYYRVYLEHLKMYEFGIIPRVINNIQNDNVTCQATRYNFQTMLENTRSNVKRFRRGICQRLL